MSLCCSVIVSRRTGGQHSNRLYLHVGSVLALRHQDMLRVGTVEGQGEARQGIMD